MDSRKISNVGLVLVVLSFLVLPCVAVENAVSASDQISLPKMPYTAQIMGDNVYVRSGPGTNFYRCGKMFKGEMVKVVSRQNIWSRIVPTEKNFSWISKQYIVIDNSNPDIGIVSADNVRVYAGSEYIEPIYSDKVQLRLNKGDKVVLLGEEVGDYYKIKPPSGTYFWVNTQFAQPMIVSATETVVVESEPVEIKVTPAVKEQPKPELKLPEPTNAVVSTTVSDATEMPKRLKAYYLLQDMVKVEYAKPLLVQDYSNSKQGLNQIIADDKTDKAARYSEFLLGQINRFELAAQVEKESKLQNSQLAETIERIDSTHVERRTEFKDTGQYAVIGTIKKSNVYGPEKVLLHYTVVDSEGKIICYSLPSGAAGMTDLESFVGQKVGLIGNIEPHPQTSGALVRFTGIEIVE